MHESPSVALVGRESERQEITARLRLAAHGIGGLVLLEGDAGIGKTALARRMAFDARSRGFEIAWAGCWQTATARPLLLWTGVGTQLATDAVGSPDLAVDVANADLARLEQARRVEAWLRARAVRPLLLVLEDLHWADAATLSVLVHLSSVLPGLPVLVIATHRPASVASTAFGTTARSLHHLGTRIELRGLDAGQTGDVLTAITGQPTDARAAESIARITGGNPLFARELGRTMPPETFAGSEVNVTDSELPESLQAVISDRVSATSADCQVMLQILSVVGDESSIDVLGDVSDLDSEPLLALIDEAAAARLIRSTADSVAFRHALFRSAVHESLSSAVRARLHDRVGNTLLGRRERGLDVEAAALAHHFRAAATLGNAGRAFTFSMEAAAEAEGMLAYDVAVSRYQDALTMLALDRTLGVRSAVMLSLADARAACGDVDEARAMFRRVIDDAAGDPTTLGRAALGFSGGIGGFEVVVGDPEICTVLQRAVDALKEDDALGSRVLARLSIALTYRAPVAAREAMVSAARDRASRSGDASTIAEVLAAWCDVMAGPDHVAARRTAAQEIIGRSSSVGDLGAVALGRRLLVEALAEEGDLHEFAREADRFAGTADRLGRSEYRWYPALWRGSLAIAQGQRAAWMRARAELEPLAGVGGANASLLSKVQLCSMAFDLADAELGQYIFDEIMSPQLVLDDTQRLISATLFRAHAGAVEEAASTVDRCVDEALTLHLDSEWPAMMLQLTELIEMLGGHARVDDVRAALAPYASVWAVEGIAAGIRGPLSRALGILAAICGQRDEAEAHFDHAHLAARASGADLVAALVDHDAGRLLGDPVRLRRAENAWRRLDATKRLAQIGDLDATLSALPPPARPDSENRFACNGDVWTIVFEGEECNLGDRKGLRDLARLLAVPRQEIAALDLAAPGGTLVEGAAGEGLDEQARNAYRSRLAEIEIEVDDADRRGDGARSEQLGNEREALLQQLRGAFGLSGRARPTGASAERARTAVRSRIRDALRRVEEAHPALGRHLARSVRTGTFCVYDPDPPRIWDVTEPPHTV